MLKTVSFMRVDGSKPRGQIADAKLFDTKEWSYVKPFILVKVEEDDIPDELWMNGSVHLKLDELMGRYPNTIEEYEDEEGNQQTRTIYGYFHELGHSSRLIEEQPQITVEDVYVK
jgi:hypothetical protein